MNISVQSKNLKVTAAMREFLARHADKLGQYFPKIESVSACVEKIAKKKNDMTAALVRFRIKVPGQDVVVERRGADVYDTVVDATERAVRALKKEKERRRSIRKRVGLYRLSQKRK